jgi:nitrate reductase gamma subunit
MITLIRKGKPEDFATPTGDTTPAVLYSFTGGMSPVKKESAYLHMPTYLAGIIYHLGTFLSIALFFSIMCNSFPGSFVALPAAVFLGISVCCGMAVLLKRIMKNYLRQLSNPDDYISNLLVTAFQALTAIHLLSGTPLLYYSITILLMLYLPFGKLKHAVYFFAARYQLGFFYGRRNTWPPKNG